MRENQPYQRKPKKTRKPSGKPKIQSFQRFQTQPWIWVCLFFGFSRRFLENQQNIRENQKYKRKPQKTKTSIRENQNNQIVKGFRPTLGYVFFPMVFPKVFQKTKQTLCKTKNTKENQRKQKQTFGKTTNLKCSKVSDPPLDMFVFLKKSFCWVSLRFKTTTKHIFGKTANIKTTFGKTTKTYPRVGLKPLKTLLFGFPYVLFGVLLYVWFSQIFVGFLKTIGKKTNKPISKVWSETFKNFVFLVSPNVLCCFLLYFVVFPNVCLVFEKPSGKPQKKKHQTHIQGWV